MKKTTKKTAQANARAAKTREAKAKPEVPTITPPYADYAQYDVVQVSENGTTWADFDTIRSEADGEQARKMCEQTGVRQYRIVSGDKQTVKVAPPETQKKTSKAKPKAEKPASEPKKLSALDAAAKVLAQTDEPMNAQQLITAMTENGLWTSPGGKTPHATLYSAILREINAKKDKARFQKTSKGHFAFNTASTVE